MPAAQAEAAALWETFLFLSMAAGCATDVTTRTLPNRLCAAVWSGGLLHAVMLPGVSGLVPALGASALAGGLLFVVYAGGIIGAGDVKFFAALATFLPPASVVPALLAATTFGGILAVGLLVGELGRSLPPRPTGAREGGTWLYIVVQQASHLLCVNQQTPQQREVRPSRPRLTVPYAVALSAGVWAVRM